MFIEIHPATCRGGGFLAHGVLNHEVLYAVECIDNGNLFHFHENPNSRCPVGRNIHAVLDRRLDSIQAGNGA